MDREDRTTLPVLQTISASRRIDMVATDPVHLARRLEEKAPPKQTHTVVLWTKAPANILKNLDLRSQLLKYDQLYLHLSITGLGGSMLEPGVPKPESIFPHLAELVAFFRGPEHISIRFDPIVHLQLPDNSYVCNLEFFATLAPIMAQHGLRKVVTSWVQIYGKVAKRLERLGIRYCAVSAENMKKEAAWLRATAEPYRLELYGCCVPSWPRSSCIDGNLFNALHPSGKRTFTTRATGQRLLCGCTKSLDIGWYNSCAHGCVYCYGNPRILAKNESKRL